MMSFVKSSDATKYLSSCVLQRYTKLIEGSSFCLCVILSILVTGSCTGLIIHLLKKVQMDMIGLYKARELECNRCIFPKSIRNINMQFTKTYNVGIMHIESSHLHSSFSSSFLVYYYNAGTAGRFRRSGNVVEKIESQDHMGGSVCKGGVGGGADPGIIPGGPWQPGQREGSTAW